MLDFLTKNVNIDIYQAYSSPQISHFSKNVQAERLFRGVVLVPKTHKFCRKSRFEMKSSNEFNELQSGFSFFYPLIGLFGVLTRFFLVAFSYLYKRVRLSVYLSVHRLVKKRSKNHYRAKKRYVREWHAHLQAGTNLKECSCLGTHMVSNCTLSRLHSSKNEKNSAREFFFYSILKFFIQNCEIAVLPLILFLLRILKEKT